MKKPLRRSDSEISERLKDILSEAYVDDSHKARYCEYKGHDDRYCKITSHQSCKRCKFFSPNMLMRTRVVVEQYEDLEEEIARLENEIDSKVGVIDKQKNRIQSLGAENTVLKNGFCNDRQRCVPVDSSGDGIEIFVPKKKKKTKIICE